MKKMKIKKHNFSLTVKHAGGILFAQLMLLLIPSSCKFWNSLDVAYKLHEYTENAEVDHYKIRSAVSGEELYFKNIKGTSECEEDLPICISSSEDLIIELPLRNPSQMKLIDDVSLTGYVYDGIDERGNPVVVNNMDFRMEKLFDSVQKLGLDLNSVKKLASGITLVQDPDDEFNSTLLMYLPQNLLLASDTGGNLSPVIDMWHEKNGKQLPSYDSLYLRCDSVPPQVYNPVVYTRNENSTEYYVLVWNMPSVGLLSGVHKDIKTITVEKTSENSSASEWKKEFNLSINADGTFNITDANDKFVNLSSRFMSGAESSDVDTYLTEELEFESTASSFEHKGQPVYLLTEDERNDEDYIYTFTLTDNYGLQSSVETNVNSVRLYPLSVVDQNGNSIIDNTVIEQDENSSYATVKIIPAQTTWWYEKKNSKVKEIVNSIVWYENETDGTVYLEQNKAGTLKRLRQKLVLGENGEILNKNDFPSEVKTYIDNNLIAKNENTSDAEIVYEIYQGTDDSGKCLFSRKTEGGSIELQIPSGKIFTRVYAHLKGFADTITQEFTVEVLKSIVYVSNSGDDENNNGSKNSPFASVTKAAGELSRPDSDNNRIILLSDVKENNIQTRENSVITVVTENKNKHAVTADVVLGNTNRIIFENIDVNGNVSSGNNSILRFNNSDIKGKVSVLENSVVVLDSDTKFVLSDTSSSEDENINLGNNALIRLGQNYNYSEKVTFHVEDSSMNRIVIEKEFIEDNVSSGTVFTKDDDSEIFTLNEENPEKIYFVLNDKAYYLALEDDENLKAEKEYGKVVLKKPGITIKIPSVGKVEVQLKDSYGNKINCDTENNFTVKAGENLTAELVAKVNNSISIRSKVTLQLMRSGETVLQDSTDTNSINIPEDASGIYILKLSFEYDGIKYSENLMLNVEAAE